MDLLNDVLVVYKKSNFELYSNSPDEEVVRFIQSGKEYVKLMEKSHCLQKRSLEIILGELSRLNVKHTAIYRAQLPEVYDIENKSLIITVGGDGTVLDTSHFVRGVPILAVNSDPSTSVGYFCCCDSYGFKDVLQDIENMPRTLLNRIVVSIDGNKIIESALNDVLISHKRPAATTKLQVGSQIIAGCGLLVCTAAGSTARMYNEGGQVMQLNSEDLQYTNLGTRIREFNFAKGIEINSITRQGELSIDGPHVVYDFTLGSIINVESGCPLTLIGDLISKRKDYCQ